MADTNGSTKAKLKAVTSRTKPSRQNLNAAQSIKDGAKLPTDAREREKMIDMLARLIDVTHNWPCKTRNRKGDLVMPAPMIANGHVILAFPTGGHVIKNTVTSKGGQNFEVDSVAVIPVTSEAK
jgi:hypothetical protein